MMKAREELDVLADALRIRQTGGEELDPSAEALRLRRSGLSVVEASVVLAKGIGMPLVEVQHLMVRLAASGQDRFS